MANHDSLLAHLGTLAAASKGRLTFVSRSVKDLGAELDLDLGGSANTVCDFTVQVPGGAFRTVAYTNVVDGSKRPATRVEALGRGLAASGGKLFELNPFLLVYDYAGQQFMAVSATALFGAFTREVATRTIAKTETASFSLSPNFKNRTISMYGEVPAALIWHATVDATLTPDALINGLTKIHQQTLAEAKTIPSIVRAIQARLDASESTSAIVVTANPVTPPAVTTPTIHIQDRVRRMVKTAVRSAPAIVLVGPPGTGKTALLRELCAEARTSPAQFGLDSFHEPLWATPDESWTIRELVGGDTIANEEIRFRPGWVLQAISANRWLALDEVNRADMDRIFGGLLTWLSGGTVVLGRASTAPDAPQIELGWNTGSRDSKTIGLNAAGDLVGVSGRVQYLAGDGWRLLGTYNALDAQRVFRFGAALGRRFVRVPIPAPEPALFRNALEEQAKDVPAALVAALSNLYEAHYFSETTQLGPAVFLAMCNYIRVAASELPLAVRDGDAAESAEQSGEDTASSQSLAEAYVVHAGTWLAHLDKRDLDELGARVCGAPVISKEEWTWVTQMVRSLA